MMAFLLVLLPLLVLAWQAWQSLNALSDRAAQVNRSTLIDARRGEAMANTVLEIERSYRQYCVLDNPTLAKVYQRQRKRYADMLAIHATVLSEPALVRRLNDDLTALATLKCHSGSPDAIALTRLDDFSHANAEMVQTTRTAIFQRGQQVQQEIAARGRFFGWQALALFLVTLALVLLLRRMIIGPVKVLERMINRLGAGRDPGELRMFRGPSELRSVGQRIIWLSERLSWLEAQRHQFLRHISHELKTPLASMREGTELLVDRVAGPLTAEQDEVVAILDTSSRNLQKLIEQLLDYNRKLADSGASAVRVALAPMLENIIAAHGLPARAKRMRVTMRLAPEDCVADPGLLLSALDNLYSNAVHYGAESGNIYLKSYVTDAGKLAIDVANTGPRIPESERDTIFEPFFQGSLQRKGAVKGSGLGLSIALDCVRRMQGTLDLVECEEADVCFRIELPVVIGSHHP